VARSFTKSRLSVLWGWLGGGHKGGVKSALVVMATMFANWALIKDVVRPAVLNKEQFNRASCILYDNKDMEAIRSA